MGTTVKNVGASIGKRKKAFINAKNVFLFFVLQFMRFIHSALTQGSIKTAAINGISHSIISFISSHQIIQFHIQRLRHLCHKAQTALPVAGFDLADIGGF